MKLEGLQPGTKYEIRLAPKYQNVIGATQELQTTTSKYHEFLLICRATKFNFYINEIMLKTRFKL